MPTQATIDHQLNLLGIHRRNLDNYLYQKSLLGAAFAPPMVVNGIREERENIRRIKSILRGWNIAVADLPHDEEPAADNRLYNVFISYHKADEDWVTNELLPHLEAAGLKVLIDYRDFEIGVPRLNNIERAIDISQHTLIVMTPEWINDEWGEFQGLLASTADPAARQRKLIPLMLKPCNPPPRIAMLDYADFTKPARREIELRRLERALATTTQLPPPETPPFPDPPIRPTDDAPVDFVIVTALEEERDAMLSKLSGHRQLAPSATDIRIYYRADVPTTFSDGTTTIYRVVVMSLLGMGRVQAGVATNDAIRRWQPRYILLVGIAGGVAAKGVQLGDVLVSDQIVDYELQKVTSKGRLVRWDVHRADARLLGAVHNFRDTDWHKRVTTWRPDPNAPKRHIGPIACGDKVVAVEKVLAQLRADWPALIGVEMEAAGAATAAFQAAESPGFFMVRGVSDLADEQKGTADVDRWRAYACDIAASYTIGLLQSGPVPPAPE